MYSASLRQELKQLADAYGKNNKLYKYLHPLSVSKDTIIFSDVKFNFNEKSWSEICSSKKSEFLARTTKVHSHFKSTLPPIYEMQSSNSSDALAMNIFCYPNINKYKGLKDLLDVQSFSTIEFGFMAKVLKKIEGKEAKDSTEVDIRINKEIVCECKLTEESFTEKDKKSVESYIAFKDVFHIDRLMQNQNSYYNYQLIRNILAANQHKSRFILFTDMRRPDLAKSFYQTIRCIKDDYLQLRTNCEIIYWQDIAKVVGKDLKDFLKEKYGII